MDPRVRARDLERLREPGFERLEKRLAARLVPDSRAPQMLVGMLMPLPTKYRIYFGEPMRFTGDPDDEDSAIEEKVWVVQTTIQSMVNRGLHERKAIFW